MAYLSNTIDDEKDQVQSGTNVLSSSSPQASDTPTEAPGDEYGVSGGQSSTIQPQTSGVGQTRPTNTTGARSGSFTNLNRYVEANKPQAGRLTSKITQNFDSQAGKVESALSQKQNLLRDRLQQNQEARNKASEQAQGIVDSAARTGNLSSNDLGTFRDYMSGNRRSIGDQSFNTLESQDVSPQQARINELRKLSEDSRNVQGRADLLNQTFGSGRRDYTRGQQSLDNLLLQGTNQSGKLAQNLSQRSDELNRSLDDYRSNEQATLDQDIANQEAFQTGLTDYTTGRQESISQEGINKTMEEARNYLIALAKFEEERGNMLGNISALNRLQQLDATDYNPYAHQVSHLKNLRSGGIVTDAPYVERYARESVDRLLDPQINKLQSLVGGWKAEDVQSQIDSARAQADPNRLNQLTNRAYLESQGPTYALNENQLGRYNALQQLLSREQATASGVDSSKIASDRAALMNRLVGHERVQSDTTQEDVLKAIRDEIEGLTGWTGRA